MDQITFSLTYFSHLYFFRDKINWFLTISNSVVQQLACRLSLWLWRPPVSPYSARTVQTEEEQAARITGPKTSVIGCDIWFLCFIMSSTLLCHRRAASQTYSIPRTQRLRISELNTVPQFIICCIFMTLSWYFPPPAALQKLNIINYKEHFFLLLYMHILVCMKILFGCCPRCLSVSTHVCCLCPSGM